ALAWGEGLQVKNGKELSYEKVGDGAIKTAYIPVRHQHLAAKQLDPDFVREKLKPILESHKIGKIAQNAKFEMNVLSRVGIDFGPMVFDPMLASYIVNPDDKHGLKDQ